MYLNIGDFLKFNSVTQILLYLIYERKEKSSQGLTELIGVVPSAASQGYSLSVFRKLYSQKIIEWTKHTRKKLKLDLRIRRVNCVDKCVKD